MEELDPRVFGVIVEDESGSRRGLLLPDIPGIDDAEQQVRSPPAKPASLMVTRKLSRFRVERFGSQFYRINRIFQD